MCHRTKTTKSIAGHRQDPVQRVAIDMEPMPSYMTGQDRTGRCVEEEDGKEE
jgi:hypothetical protein